MANNCYNYITIEGNATEIKEFSALLKLETEKGQENGFDIYSNLRTEFGVFGNDAKWFDIDIQETEEENITISGDSAWCPSLELLTKISERYQSFEIRYEYDEMGCDFSGWAEIGQGNCNDNQFEYWKGLFEMRGEDELLHQVIENELDCYDSEEELQEADFFSLFTEENQAEILENWNGRQ